MAISRNLLKQVMLDNQRDIEGYKIYPRHTEANACTSAAPHNQHP